MTNADKFTLRKIRESIYLATFPTQYDVNMHFVRAQEYYESPNPQFRGETFKLLDFMRWYSVDRKGSNGTFSYTDDWSGFNIPSWVLEEVYVHKNIPDENDYDITMRALYETVRRLDGPKSKFYIIGCVEHGTALDHELAHGLFYAEDGYREAQLKHIEDMVAKRGKNIREVIYDTLIADGYCADVLADELHAYMATGISGSMEAHLFDLGFDSPRKLTNLRKPFIDTFERWALTADMPWRTVKRHKKKDKSVDSNPNSSK